LQAAVESPPLDVPPKDFISNFVGPDCKMVKNFLAGCSKSSRMRGARQIDPSVLLRTGSSGGVLGQYVGARRLSATKHMRLFQRPAMQLFAARSRRDRSVH